MQKSFENMSKPILLEKTLIYSVDNTVDGRIFLYPFTVQIFGIKQILFLFFDNLYQFYKNWRLFPVNHCGNLLLVLPFANTYNNACIFFASCKVTFSSDYSDCCQFNWLVRECITVLCLFVYCECKPIDAFHFILLSVHCC